MLEGADEEAFEGCPGARIIEPREHVFSSFLQRGVHTVANVVFGSRTLFIVKF